MTNDPDGPLAATADIVLPLVAGVEEGGVACLTFQATLAVLQLLAASLTGAGPESTTCAPPSTQRQRSASSRERVARTLADHVAAAHTTYTIAPPSGSPRRCSPR